MTTKNKILTVTALLAITIITSCSNQQQESLTGDNLELTSLTKILTDDDFMKESFVSDSISQPAVSTVIPRNRDDLNKMRTVVKIFNGKDNAGISLPGFGGLKLGKDESSLNVYYIETKVVNTASDSVVYGCGYSIHYLFKKVEKGISVDNIPSVAASAQLNSKKTQVFYSLQTYGMKGTNLVRYFKPTVNKNFNVEGFGIMQSSIDGIHNILGDTTLSKTVKFEPEILKFIKAYELGQL
ncbi:hypothetical protein [Cyclobacterium xiamenense]|uniref:hypothetical protein n=1 Tax=Cyclobacterium xiamenense TaxID=1297121 RepID=UPI0035D0DDA9